MPKSKRDKKISLTKTPKKGLERKQNLIEEIRKNIDMYDRLFLFNVYNMRSSHMKEVRKGWDHSRFFFGKNKVMAIALGKTPETELMDGLHKMSSKLANEVGLLFTNKSQDYVTNWFANYSKFDYARSGNVATSTVELAEGPLNQFSHSIEPHLRKLGLPVTLQKGIVTMLWKHTVCKEGQILTPEQASILKLLQIVLSEFSIGLECMWDKGTSELIDFDNKQKEKSFNVVRVTADDQEYDYVEKENEKVSPMIVEDSLKAEEISPEKDEIVPETKKGARKTKSAKTAKQIVPENDTIVPEPDKGTRQAKSVKAKINTDEKDKSVAKPDKGTRKARTVKSTIKADEIAENRITRVLRPRKNKQN